jgi:hypothetical protein
MEEMLLLISYLQEVTILFGKRALIVFSRSYLFLDRSLYSKTIYFLNKLGNYALLPDKQDGISIMPLNKGDRIE